MLSGTCPVTTPPGWPLPPGSAPDSERWAETSRSRRREQGSLFIRWGWGGPHQEREKDQQKGESTTKNTPESATTHLCFFSCFHISFFGTSFSFFGDALCSLREAFPSFFFFLPSWVLWAVLRFCFPSSSRCLLCSTCFLWGESGLGLPLAPFWPTGPPHLPVTPSALGAGFLEGLLPELSPAGAGKRQVPAVRNQMFKMLLGACWLQRPLLEPLVLGEN